MKGSDKGLETDRYGRLTHRVEVITLLLVLGILALWILVGRYSPEPFLEGTYGDSFGVLTALFSGLAFAGLYYSIRLQKIELEATREVLDEQSKSIRKQVFESTFFQLLNQLNDVRDRIVYTDPVSHTKHDAGRPSLEALYLNYKSLFGADGSTNTSEVLTTFDTYLRTNPAHLRHYFRVLYHLFAYIADSGLPPREQRRYASVARAGLSSYELALLFYNGLVGEGAQGMKLLIEQFSLLKHVEYELLIERSGIELRGMYDAKAFAD